MNRFFLTSFLYITCFAAFALDVPMDDFPIQAYTQNLQYYLPKDDPDYLTPLLTPAYQAAQLQQFYLHYYATDSDGLSPWSEQLVNAILPSVKTMEQSTLKDFDNQNKDAAAKHYGENFKEHDEVWLARMQKLMNISALDGLSFKAENRAIATQNTSARALPDTAPDFLHLTIAGQGFPFDNLQESAIWAGTPLYVIQVSQDKAWSLVLTPDAYFAWIKSSDLAYVSDAVMIQLQTAAKQALVAVTKTEVSILDQQTQQFLLTGYIGSVFPLLQQNEQTMTILLPVKNAQQQVELRPALIKKNAAALMPLTASPKNMALLLRQLKHRPYGWGGVFFFNDCSQEMKSLFTPFGIWLPRNSAQQAKAGRLLDLSDQPMSKRLDALKTQGHPLMTLIYTGGHVMLYIGNQTQNGLGVIPFTYQSMWGLASRTAEKRYVIGQSVFFPLLSDYPDHPDAKSPASKAFFKLIYLDERSAHAPSPKAFSTQFSPMIREQLS